MHLGADREHALGISQHQIMDRHVAIDRPVDPADLDLHARFHLERGNLLDQEFLARLGIEAEQQARDQNHQRHDQTDRTDRDLLP